MRKTGNKKINILVTGASNGVGQSILKSLKISKLKINVIPGDISSNNPVKFRYPKFVIFPKVESKNSLSQIIKIIRVNKIQILFVGSEYEIEFFSRNKILIEKETGCIVSVSSLKTILISNDKYKTFLFLKKIKVNCPKTFECKNMNDAIKNSKKTRFPLYIKPKNGTSAKNTFFCKNIVELKSYFKIVENPIIQEFIGNGQKTINNNEYTCSYFVDKKNKMIGPFIAKRNLKFGTSWQIEIVKNNKLKNLMNTICKNLDVSGSVNVQFKEKNSNIYPIEINSRFSGTTAVRANFGFNEPEMFIKNYFLNQDIKNINIRYGKVYRYIEEVFINKKLKNNKMMNKKSYINKWF